MGDDPNTNHGDEFRRGKVFECHMAEYTQCRNEIVASNRLVDRTIFIYLSALFTFAGIFLNTKEPAWRIYELINYIQTDIYVKSAVLFVVVLQTFLVLMVDAHSMNIYRNSKHTSKYLRDSVAKVLDVNSKEIFDYDTNRNLETKIFIKMRGISTALWFGFVVVLNLIVLAVINWKSEFRGNYELGASIVAAGFNCFAVGEISKLSVIWNSDTFDKDLGDGTIDAEEITGKMRKVKALSIFLSFAAFIIAIFLGALLQ